MENRNDVDAAPLKHIVSQLRAACADPDGPIYGSYIVPAIGDLIERCEQLERRGNAWRRACRYLYELCQRGISGTPSDRMGKRGWHRVVNLISDADSMDDLAG